MWHCFVYLFHVAFLFFSFWKALQVYIGHLKKDVYFNILFTFCGIFLFFLLFYFVCFAVLFCFFPLFSFILENIASLY